MSFCNRCRPNQIQAGAEIRRGGRTTQFGFNDASERRAFGALGRAFAIEFGHA